MNSFFGKVVSVLKPVTPVLSFERQLGRGVSQNQRQKRKAVGVKRLDGDCVKAGETLVVQFFMNFHPGLNVRILKNNTLKSMRPGRVMMTCEKINPKKGQLQAEKYYGNLTYPVYKRYFHVIPFTQGTKFKLIDLV